MRNDTDTMIAMASNLICRRRDRGNVVTSTMIDEVVADLTLVLEQYAPVDADLLAVTAELRRRNNIA